MEGLDWENTKTHLDEVIEEYEHLVGVIGVNTIFALRIVLYPLKRRYDNGERTEQLYNEMLSTR